MEHACLLPSKAWHLCNLQLVLNNAAANIWPVCHVILHDFTMFALLSIQFHNHMLLVRYVLKLMDLVCIEQGCAMLIPLWLCSTRGMCGGVQDV